MLNKRLLLLVIVLQIYFHLGVAQKYDNTWLMGLGTRSNDSLQLGMDLTFNSGIPIIKRSKRFVDFERTSVSISDPLNGKILFYSNGCNIYNSIDSIMENGNDINSGMFTRAWCQSAGFYFLDKGGVIIPVPNSLTKFYLIHRSFSDAMGNFVNPLFYSIIDIEFNNGLGKVVDKNIPLLSQNLHIKQFDIVKHANGIDYWIITYNATSDSAFTFLINSTGINGPFIQEFAFPKSIKGNNHSSTISPNGKLYVKLDPYSGLHICDFNRNDGLFSNIRSLPFWTSIDSSSLTSVCFSESSRYLYVSTSFRLFQFDMKDSDVFKSLILVDTFDLYSDPFYNFFYLMQLGPDGRIYLNSSNGTHSLHVIHKPELPGKFCEFKQHDFKLPSQNAFTMPYFPNYRLGPLVSTEDKDKLTKTINVYPNPSRGMIHIESYDDYTCILKDLQGKVVLVASQQSIDLCSISSGIYLLELWKHDVRLQVEKICLQKE